MNNYYESAHQISVLLTKFDPFQRDFALDYILRKCGSPEALSYWLGLLKYADMAF